MEKLCNPCIAPYITPEMREMLSGIRCLEDGGRLYELSYTGDYTAEAVRKVLQESLRVGAGCSAFSAYNMEGDFLLCRNYDFRHQPEGGEVTGLNVVIHTAPKGKLASVGICDAWWLNPGVYRAGAFGDGETDLSPLIISPWLCVDGMNEAGVSGALLALATKPGETPVDLRTGRERVNHSVLLRLILDSAHNLGEALEIAASHDVFSALNMDLHLVLCDADGRSAVLEWRKTAAEGEYRMHVIPTNAVTNFYLGFDDCEDMYREDGTLREKAMTLRGTVNAYRYGYGHGYRRFCGMVSALDRYADFEKGKNADGVIQSRLHERQAVNILAQASQEPDAERTSQTQYSALYDMTKRTLRLYLWREYEKEYVFGLKG